MKGTVLHILIPLFVLITTQAFAQTEEEKDRDLAGGKVFKVIVQTGLSLQWFDPGHQLFNLSLETQRGPYQHYGIVMGRYLNSDNYYSARLKRNSIEVGMYGKFFLHGRLTGRKSRIYFGPELRYGTRRFRSNNNGFFPPPTYQEEVDYNLKVTKVMIRWGWQYRFDNIMLEFALPFGREYAKSDFIEPTTYYYPYYASEGNQFIVMPTLQMGIGF